MFGEAGKANNIHADFTVPKASDYPNVQIAKIEAGKLVYVKCITPKDIQSALVNVNGEIIITLFQEMLRPKAKKELTSIKTFAQKIGTIEIVEDFITYITPLFEKELFNYKNIPCYGNWRIADLLIIKKLNNNVLPSVKNIKSDVWTRIEIGTQTVAIDNKKGRGKKVKVRFPYEDEDSLIKSVSERKFFY